MNDQQDNSTALLLDAEASAQLLGISRSHFYGMDSSGRLGPMPIKLGKSTRWRRDELERWVTSDCPSRQKWQAMKEASR